MGFKKNKNLPKLIKLLEPTSTNVDKVKAEQQYNRTPLV